jgi:hypothetical protein
MMLLDEGDEFLADFAAEIPRSGGVGGGGERADLDGFIGGVGDLKHADLAIPKWRLMEDSLEFGAERVDGDGIIRMKKDAAEDIGGDAGPILEGPFDEVIDGEDEAAEVPDPDDDVGEGDFLDPAPFVFDDDDVIDSNGLGEGDLKAGEEIGDGSLGGKANDDADDAGGGEDAGAELADLIEEHEDGSERENDDDEEEGFFENEDLGMNLACAEIVSDGDVVTADDELLAEVDDLEKDPGDGTDDEETAGSGDEPGVSLGQAEEWEGQNDGNNGHEGAQGAAEERDDEAIEVIAGGFGPEPESDLNGMGGAKGEPEEGGEQAEGEEMIEEAQRRMIDVGWEGEKEWSDGEVKAVEPESEIDWWRDSMEGEGWPTVGLLGGMLAETPPAKEMEEEKVKAGGEGDAEGGGKELRACKGAEDGLQQPGIRGRGEGLDEAEDEVCEGEYGAVEVIGGTIHSELERCSSR